MRISSFHDLKKNPDDLPFEGDRSMSAKCKWVGPTIDAIDTLSPSPAMSTSA
jgi:hypothetical protein